MVDWKLNTHHSKKQGGSYEILLVLIISIILSSAVITAQSATVQRTRESVSSLATQKAFFLAEGALKETYSRIMNSNRTWPEIEVGETYSDQYTLNEVDVDRKILKINDDSLNVDVTASYRDYKRRLTGDITFSGEETGVQDADIVVILDTSSSMVADGTEPWDVAQDAADYFVGSFNDAPNIRFSLITYNRIPTLNQPLTFDHNSVRTILQNGSLTTAAGTNTAGAIALANAHLESSARPEASKMIVLLSDGYPSWAEDTGPQAAMYSLIAACAGNCNLCQDQNLAPDDTGTCCTNAAVLEANNAKGNDIELFSISIVNPNILDDTCMAPLSELTLLRSSSEDPTRPIPADGENYPYFKHVTTSNIEDLHSLYDEIAGVINTIIGHLNYSETPPEP